MLQLIILTILSIILSVILTLGTLWTYKMQISPRQKVFLAGSVPKKAPEGVYKGLVPNLKTNWNGKSFTPKDSSGINIFKQEDGKTTQQYPFKTYLGKGIQDKNKEVFKIDYNIKGNPLWLKFILDEIVEIKPNKFLGKVHIKFLPNIAFTMGYFTLEK